MKTPNQTTPRVVIDKQFDPHVMASTRMKPGLATLGDQGKDARC